MKMKMYLLILSLATLVHLGNTLSCQRCCADQPPSFGPDGQIIMVDCTSCVRPPHPCQLVKDACGCCDVCARTEGEECGGLWNIAGICADGLTCVNPDHGPSISPMMNTPGVCMRTGAGCCNYRWSWFGGRRFELVKGHGFPRTCWNGCDYILEGDSEQDGIYCFENDDNCLCECDGVTRWILDPFFGNIRPFEACSRRDRFQGRPYCYVKSPQCPDAKPSQRFPGVFWSFSACHRQGFAEDDSDESGVLENESDDEP